jgi:predicted DNA-binding transcriptional regulator
MNDELRVIGIDAKGYGRIYKAAMRSKELNILAKCIYSYLSAYAGNGSAAFPKRDKIVRDLQINKDTLGKYMKQLIDTGFLTRERTATGNLYTINTQIPMMEEKPLVADEEASVLTFGNIRSWGFGTVPKLVMLDVRLSAKAKAIYAYFCSFAGAGSVAFPHKKTIIRELGLSEHTYYTHFHQLTETGYVTVKQRKASGRFDVSEYRLNDEVEKPVPSPSSEKLQCGGKLMKSGVSSENLQSGELTSGNLQSGQITSDEMEREFFGQPNIKNNTIRNNSINNSFDKEQVYNHQTLIAPDDVENPLCMLSVEEIKEIIDYPNIAANLDAWVNLKEILGHYRIPGDREQYRSTAFQALDELITQLSTQPPKQLRERREAIHEMLFSVVDNIGQIRNPRRYIKAAIDNLFLRG